MAPSSSKPPPPPSTDDTSSVSDSDEEETESSESDKALPAPEPEGKKREFSPSAEAKNLPPTYRIWSVDDEVRILKALAAHREEHGTVPLPGELLTSLAGHLDFKGPSRKEVSAKVSKLNARYAAAAKKGVPSKGPERRLYKLSKIVWGDEQTRSSRRRGARRGFEEMCGLYPHLAGEVRSLAADHPGMVRRAFEKMGDATARKLDARIKKHRLSEMKLEIRRKGMIKEVMTTCTELLE